MGDWVISTLQAKDRPDDELDNDTRFAEVVRHVFNHAEVAGLGSIVQIDQNNGEPYLTREFEEDSGLVDILEDYEDEVFWQALIERLAHRDFIRHYGETAISAMAIEERIEKETPFHDKWATEFHDNGIENLKI